MRSSLNSSDIQSGGGGTQPQRTSQQSSSQQQNNNNNISNSIGNSNSNSNSSNSSATTIRSTYHDIYDSAHGDYFIVSTLSFRRDTQIIRIDGRCGLMMYEGLPGLDLFPNHRQATAFLQKKYNLKSKVRVSALLGYIIGERAAYLLVANKIRSEGELLGVHPLFMVQESSWIKIELSYLSSFTSAASSSSSRNANGNNSNNINNINGGGQASSCEPLSASTSSTSEAYYGTSELGSSTSSTASSHGHGHGQGQHSMSSSTGGTAATKDSSETAASVLKQLQAYPLDGTHFFCETYDLTSCFPSHKNTPYQYCSEFTWNEWLRRPFDTFSLSHLCVVLLQGYVSIKSVASQSLSICYIMKRSKLNPETYSFGHGINERAGAANEYECELIMWKIQKAQQTSTSMSSNSSNAPSSTVNWTSNVWRRGTIPLWWRSRQKNQSTDIQVKDNPFEGSEQYFAGLLQHYQSMYEPSKMSLPNIHLVNLLRADDTQEGPLAQLYQQGVERVMSLINLNLNLVHFDWAQCLKNQSLAKTVQSLWNTMRELMDTAGFSKGVAKVVNDDGGASSLQHETHGTPNVDYSINPTDRKLVFEQFSHQKEIIKYSCLESLERVNIATYFTSFQLVALMGRALGVGFNDMFTFSNNVTLDYMINTHKQHGLFQPLTEFYATSSDVCNILYHHNSVQQPKIMQEFTNSVSLTSMNHLLSFHRKYTNTYQEENRNKQYLTFLGLLGSRFFPSNMGLQLERPSYTISIAPVSCVSSIPTILAKSNLSPSILVREIDDFSWIFPSDTNNTDVTIYLSQPCIVTELCLTVAHGTNSDTYPQVMDVLLGDYHNDMHVVLQDVAIPRCTTGTKLSYHLPYGPWDQYSAIADDLRITATPSNRFFNRFVKIIFKGNNLPLTIGKIEVFGHYSNRVVKPVANVHRSTADQVARIESTRHSSVDRNNGYDNFTNFILDSDAAGTEHSKAHASSNGEYRPTYSSESIGNMNGNSNGNGNLYDTIIDNQINNILSILQCEKGVDITAATTASANLTASNNSTQLQQQQQQQLQHSGNGAPESAPETGNKSPDMGSPNEILLIRDYSGGQTFMEEMNSQEVAETFKISSHRKRGAEASNTPTMLYEQELQTVLNGSSSSSSSGSNNNSAHIQRLGFVEALELEMRRIQLNVTPMERDKLLQQLGIPCNSVNPMRFIFEREEKIEHSIRKNTKNKQSSSWTCQRPQCGKELGYFDKFRHKQCNYCYKRFCPSCMSAATVKIIEYESTKPIAVCNNCSMIIAKQESYLKRMAEANNIYYKDLASFNLTFYQRVLHQLQQNTSSQPNHSFDSLYKTLIPLSEYPKSGILNSVPTDINSPPIETILLPPGVLPFTMFWYAPPNVNSVDVNIVLAYDSQVYSITLLVDSLGYYNYNVPSVDIKIGKNLCQSDMESVGPWVFQPNGWSSNPSQIIQPQSCISYILPQPRQARVISLRFTLPNLPTFLTYDNSEPVKPFLHLGRIAVHGYYNDSLSEVPSFLSSSIPLEASDKELYENTLYSVSSVTPKRNPIHLSKIITAQKSARTIHISIDSTVTVKGVSIIISHDDNEGVRSQVKGITISCVIVNQKNELLSHQFLSQILVPKSRLNSTLYFDLPNIPPSINLLSFEFTSNYGGTVLSIPKVNLY
ncbi:hypothetical protein SAMD00019534_093270 [Acytostelium subglobosum LB1]|uniref:hypothetical protein n=1 Tax=Acytostelium subglobosum LB1 TaxID=1410327 RepID=UPI000644E36A|nr:hypothetical protein SAMD00019534_093270 [Acytostelium subglobosum LB1]GAM26152.1 hypothetical protein SAMD00019534_093270 [Acytostelium subglobosum LB1]|eukprot:XP_012750706.1 hypothetical protein SAMD00019534_093270 [Acytostelium subglobosum LB1]